MRDVVYVVMERGELPPQRNATKEGTPTDRAPRQPRHFSASEAPSIPARSVTAGIRDRRGYATATGQPIRGSCRPGGAAIKPEPAPAVTAASAGRTRSRTPCSTRRSEHPRVGGEDSVAMYSSHRWSGTPPHRRGGPPSDARQLPVVRNTPASAGRTSPTRSTSTRSSEHPRVGGEDGHATPEFRRSCGTPPRRRGGLPLRLGRYPRDRNTPASAGRTTMTGTEPRTTAEHPRVGGEDPF